MMGRKHWLSTAIIVLLAVTPLLVLSAFSDSFLSEANASVLLTVAIYLLALFTSLYLAKNACFSRIGWLSQLTYAFTIGVVLFLIAYFVVRYLGASHGAIAPFDTRTTAKLGAVLVGLVVWYNLPIPKLALVLANLLVAALLVYPSLGHFKHNSGAGAAYRFSIFHDLKVTDYTVVDRGPVLIPGGGIDIVDASTLLLVTGDGRIRVIDLEDGEPRVLPLVLETPFEALTDQVNYPEPLTNFLLNIFRVTDAHLVKSNGSESTLYVSYHHWDSANTCVSLKVAQAELHHELRNQTELKWQTIYTSDPCLNLKERGSMFGTTGGRMAVLDNQTLLISVGTTLADKDWDTEALAESDYGKIIAINRTDFSNRIFTSGHRNPQGLFVGKDGQIWSTEHGPDGGDELNLLKNGQDYGWPIATYGNAYESKTWAKNPVQGDHTNGQRPLFAWVPSIGVSSLIQVKGHAFKHWKGDLMVGSLFGRGEGKSLYRVKIADDRVQVVERINFDRPVRDLIELADGRLVLWDGGTTLQFAEPVEHIFESCSGCHAMAGFEQGIGPHLQGIVGAKTARSRGYTYSTALENLGGRWTRKRLLAFIENPQSVVPGTSMNFAGMVDEADREALVDYLENIGR